MLFFVGLELAFVLNWGNHLLCDYFIEIASSNCWYKILIVGFDSLEVQDFDSWSLSNQTV